VHHALYRTARLLGSIPWSPLARVGRRILVRAGDRGDPAAVDTVWQSWLRDPADESWELLSRWRGAPAATEAACEAALAALPERALAEFCVARSLTPADPVRRAMFLLLTGQYEQCRAADPEGSLLALGYAAADDAGRERLRAAMADAGDLDLARVVSARPDRPVSDAERDYLVAELSGRREWAGLWRLALGLPLALAIATVRRIDGTWRPDGAPDRDLFRLLRTAASPDLSPPDGALSTAWIELPDHHIHDGSFSPDGWRLAIAFSRGTVAGQDFETSVCEIGLPQGRLIARYVFANKWPVKVLHLGDVIVAMVADSHGGPTSLYRLADGERESLDHDGLKAMVRYAGGFAALRHDRLVFCDNLAREAADVRLAETPSEASMLLGTSPGTGAGPLVIGSRDHIWVYTPFAERMVTHEPHPLRGGACGVLFAEQDRLLTWTPEGLVSMRLAEGRLAPEPHRRYSPSRERGEHIVSAAHFPRQGKLAILTSANQWMSGPLRYVDDRSLDRTGWAGGLPGDKTGRCLIAAPDGTHAIGRGRTLTIAYARHPLTGLIGQPLSAMTPGDYSAVAAALKYQDFFPGTRPVLQLLATCLEFRFGSDVAIGQAVRPTAPDDIELS
jgi:hypothetical protein